MTILADRAKSPTKERPEQMEVPNSLSHSFISASQPSTSSNHQKPNVTSIKKRCASTSPISDHIRGTKAHKINEQDENKIKLS